MSIQSRRVRLRHLVAGWGVYWGGLAVATLAPAAATIARLSQTGAKGSATLGYDDGMFNAEIREAGRVAWQGAASTGELTFWLAVPPLLIFAAWLWFRRGQPGEGGGAVDELDRRRALSSAGESAAAGPALSAGGADVIPLRKREQMFVEPQEERDPGL